MNASNVESKPKVRKETKRKIKVDFERTSFKERFKAKFLTFTFIKKVAWTLIRYVLLIGIAYIVLFPFFSKISASLMAPADFNDSMVRLIPKNFSIGIYKAIFVELSYMKAFGNTLLLSLITAVIQTFISSFIAYGFAKFKFKGNKILFALVILTMIIPHGTLQTAMSGILGGGFDILGIFRLFGSVFGDKGIPVYILKFVDDMLPMDLMGKINELIADSGFQLIVNDSEFSLYHEFFKSIKFLEPINKAISWSGIQFKTTGLSFMDSYWPFILLSLTGLAFKNGLYIFLLRQFFMGVPDELEESAYIDGSGVFRTFFTIILPLSVPMMITVFLFSFSWSWTDTFYADMFLRSSDAPVLLTSDIGFDIPPTLLNSLKSNQTKWYAAIRSTGGLMIIAPLVVVYLFCQKYLVQGIERSGLTAD